MNVAARRIGLQVGDLVRPSAAWRPRYYDCWLWHWRWRGPGEAPLAWTGAIESFFVDRDGQPCAVVQHPLEDCGCDFKASCWRCEGTGVTTRRAVPITNLEPI